MSGAVVRYLGVPHLDVAQHARLVVLRRWSLVSALSGIAVVALAAVDLSVWPAVLAGIAAAVCQYVAVLRVREDWMVARAGHRDLWVRFVPGAVNTLAALSLVVVKPHLWWLGTAAITSLVLESFTYGRAGALAAIRMRQDKIFTPVYHLAHPRSGRRVTLISTSAVGTVEYFHAVSARIIDARRAGVDVHYEGIKSPPPRRLAAASAVEQLLVASVGIADAEEATGVHELGLKDSSEALVIPYTSRNADLDQLDAVRAGVANPLTKRLILRRNVKPEPIMLVLNHFRVAAALAWFANLISPVQFSYHQFVEDRRNVALAEAWTALAARDLTMTWGPSHIPAFVRSFCTAGYRIADTEWVEVLDIGAIRDRHTGATLITPVCQNRFGDTA